MSEPGVDPTSGISSGVVLKSARAASGMSVARSSTRSGKEAALRLLPPLRTVHASFPAHGSSLFKGQLVDPDALFIVVGATVMLTYRPIEPTNALGSEVLGF